MKYIIDIPDNTHWIQWIMEGTKDHHPYMDWKQVEDLTPHTEPDRKAIEDEVWELTDYICRMGMQERDLCFGFQLTTEVTANLSYQEVKDKFEKWMENEIHVGDEIYSDGDYEIAIVMEIHGDGSVSVYTKNGCIEHWWNKMHNLKKTGRYFPEVAELLEKMRGEEE